MFWAVLCGLALAEDDALSQARAELAVLLSETEDPEVRASLERIDARLSEAQGEAAEPETEPEPEPEPEPEEAPEPSPDNTAKSACTPEEYQAVVADLEEQDFTADKLNALEKAGARLHFTTDQLLGLLDGLDFGADKVRAAALLHPRLVDPQDFERVYEMLDFDSDREALRALIAEPAPSSDIDQKAEPDQGLIDSPVP